ncbi:conserved domain protein [delta proteobacterium NaphS2]|nr:conserved domain protein [delta proteobacterium NaphS2]
MTDQNHNTSSKEFLDDDDRIHITEIFENDIAARLMQMDAKCGNISCEFAGPQYRNWVIEFKSSRWGLEIVDFEYDENARSFGLPTPFVTLEHQ